MVNIPVSTLVGAAFGLGVIIGVVGLIVVALIIAKGEEDDREN